MRLLTVGESTSISEGPPLSLRNLNEVLEKPFQSGARNRLKKYYTSRSKFRKFTSGGRRNVNKA